MISKHSYKSILTYITTNNSSSVIFPCRRRLVSPSNFRSISSTPISASWMDKVKGVLTGQKDTSGNPPSGESFTLLRFAEEMNRARKLGSLKQYIVGKSSGDISSGQFERQEAIIRCLGGYDPTGENIKTTQKEEAARNCNCTVADVENVLAKFLWAKQAQRKLEELKEQGKPMPKSMAEIQKLMGTSPLDVARSNLAKSGNVSRNSPCPCGSKKLYKRCCGKDKPT